MWGIIDILAEVKGQNECIEYQVLFEAYMVTYDYVMKFALCESYTYWGLWRTLIPPATKIELISAMSHICVAAII